MNRMADHLQKMLLKCISWNKFAAIVNKIFQKICTKWTNWRHISTESNNGLVPSGPQANIDPDLLLCVWHHQALAS